MSSLRSLKWRYATQKFDENKLIPEEKIEVIKEAFNLTPTSYGMQPVRLIVIQNKAIQQKLFEYSYWQEQVKTASQVLVFCTETEIDDQFIIDSFNLEKEIRNTPDDIIEKSKTFRLELFRNWSNEEKQQWAINQLYLTLGNILTVCAHECIDACPMEGFQAEKYDDYLKLSEQNLKSRLILPIGYRAQDDFFADFKKVRRPLNEMIIDIK